MIELIGISHFNKVNWLQYGEKNNAYFFGLEKQKQKTPIKAIKINDEITTDNSQILKELQNFYVQLFKTRFTEYREPDFSFLDGLSMPQLDQEEKCMLDEPLFLEEIHIAIKQMKRERTPGIDGFPIEFYDKFWPRLKFSLHSLYLNVTEKNGKFPESTRTGIITLIEKKGKDQLLVENWRPITLLCCDYKIFAKVIANRIESVVQKLVHSDETGFIKGRSIGQNLMELNSVLMVAEREKAKATILVFDFRKAYDMLEPKYLFHVLKKFNFGGKYFELDKVMFSLYL